MDANSRRKDARLDRIVNVVQAVAAIVLIVSIIVVLAFTARTQERLEDLARSAKRQSEINATVLREMRAAIVTGNEGQGKVIEQMLAEIRVIVCEENAKAEERAPVC